MKRSFVLLLARPAAALCVGWLLLLALDCLAREPQPASRSPYRQDRHRRRKLFTRGTLVFRLKERPVR